MDFTAASRAQGKHVKPVKREALSSAQLLQGGRMVRVLTTSRNLV